MADSILLDRDGPVTTITLNLPETGNLVSNEMGAELAAMIAGADDDCRLIILRGAGENFCIGREVARPATKPTALDIRANVTEPALELYAAFRRSRIPILGVIQGRAEGFGCAVAALCDMTFAADDARFKVPEMDRDLPPTLLMSALADRMSRKTVMYLVYSRDEIDAETAFTMGMISRVVPAAELDSAVDGLVRTLSDNSPAAIRAVKEYMRSAPDMDRQGASDFASNLLANVLASR